MSQKLLHFFKKSRKGSDIDNAGVRLCLLFSSVGEMERERERQREEIEKGRACSVKAVLQGQACDPGRWERPVVELHSPQLLSFISSSITRLCVWTAGVPFDSVNSI